MTAPVRIPADVELEDRLLGRLTARQLVILTAAAAVLYLAWTALRTVVPVAIFFVAATPVGALAVALALGRRDGISLDRFVAAALRHRLGTRVPSHERDNPAVPGWVAAPAVTAPAGPGGPRHPATPVHLPARGVADTGVIDLGGDGLALLAVASTVNFTLCTPGEQDAMVATFARYLHSLSAPLHLLIRALPLDLSPQITELRAAVPRLPHPALAAAAADHADYLSGLGQQHELLRRQVLLVLREPADQPPTRPRASRGSPSPAGGARAADARLTRRLAEAVELLAPAGITVTPLGAGQARAVLAAACRPGRPPSPSAPAHPDDVITGRWAA